MLLFSPWSNEIALFDNYQGRGWKSEAIEKMQES